MGELVLRTDPVDGVVVLTLNRPDALNALSIELFRAFDWALGVADADPSVRAIVITASGDRAFSAGYDVHEMKGWDADRMLAGYLEREPWQWHAATVRTPTIAAMNGPAFGGGAVLAIGCDMRIGSPVTTFRVTAATYGGVNASWSLPPIVGIGRAKEWLMTGRTVDASEALNAGLLNRIVEPVRVVPEAVEMAAAIAANPAAGTRAVKALVNAGVGRSLESAFRSESSLMATDLRPGRVDELFSGFLESHANSAT